MSGAVPTRDDSIVTIRDIYVLVQQVNTRTSELIHQVNTLTVRAEEDRRQADELADEMRALKLKFYTAMGTVTAILSLLVILGQLGFSFA